MQRFHFGNIWATEPSAYLTLKGDLFLSLFKLVLSGVGHEKGQNKRERRRVLREPGFSQPLGKMLVTSCPRTRSRGRP